MLAPRKVRFEAKKCENENMEFRIFLKCNADPKELDRQFFELHNELFDKYDCSRCRNCCKRYHGNIPVGDIEKDAEYLHMTREEFMNTFLESDLKEHSYRTKNMPCDFLQEDGNCMLGECRPDNCKMYPYTNRPERLYSLYSVLEAIEVCPVAFEIYERLKKEYGFQY